LQQVLLRLELELGFAGSRRGEWAVVAAAAARGHCRINALAVVECWITGAGWLGQICFCVDEGEWRLGEDWWQQQQLLLLLLNAWPAGDSLQGLML